ncbi:MAG: hypothetical protein RLO05_04660 [Rhodospirillales bacterium]
MPTFEFEIHNRDVLDALKSGDSHKFFKDEWADTHFIEFSGNDETEARRRAERRYPAAQGFVITGVKEA